MNEEYLRELVQDYSRLEDIHIATSLYEEEDSGLNVFRMMSDYGDDRYGREVAFDPDDENEEAIEMAVVHNVRMFERDIVLDNIDELDNVADEFEEGFGDEPWSDTMIEEFLDEFDSESDKEGNPQNSNADEET